DPTLGTSGYPQELWYRYVPESGNWHGGTPTRWIEALSAATEKRFRRDANVDIALVSKENYLVFQPLLPEVLAGSIGLCDVAKGAERRQQYGQEGVNPLMGFALDHAE